MFIQTINSTKSIEELKTPLAEIVKQVAGTAARVTNVEDWGLGALNRCLKVKIAHPAETFFIKIENDDILPVSRRGQIAREVAGNRSMQAAGVRCPAVLACDTAGSQAGIRYLVEEFIDAELLWVVREQLTPADRERLKADIQAVLAKMQSVTSPVYGDIYPGGWIGQFDTYPACFRRQWAMDLADCQALDLFTADEVELANQALEQAAQALAANQPATFYHGDLGIHNLLVDPTPGGLRMGWVIDFGNALFLPAYLNEDGLRRHGGFGLEIKPCESYGITPVEHAANELLGTLNWIAFAGMLWRTGRWKAGPQEQIANFIAACKANQQEKNS